MSDDKESQAIDWFVRLRRPDVSREDQVLHSEWMGDNENAEAFERIIQDWSLVADLDGWARDEITVMNLELFEEIRKRRYRGLTLGGIAALLVLTISLGFALLDRPDRLSTETAEQRKVTLDDGSSVHLNTNSLVDIKLLSNVREVVLEHGEVLLDVRHETRPFIVHAGNTAVTVLGTQFSVRRMTSGETEVVVLEGRVVVSSLSDRDGSQFDRGRQEHVSGTAENENIILVRNQRLVIDGQGRAAKPESIIASRETSWSEGKLIFDNTPLRTVISEISRYVPDEIKVAEGVPDHLVTGVIKIRDADSMLDLLSQAVPINAVKNTSSVTILYPKKPTSDG